MTWRVNVQCSSDKTGKEYEPGDIVVKGDFPAAIIQEWVDMGVLSPDEGD